MRIAISGLFWGQPNVGSGQYLRGLLGGLARAAPEHELLLLVPGYQRGPELPGGLAAGRLSIAGVPTPLDRRGGNLAKLWFEQVAAPAAAARLRADLLHVPYFAPPLRSRVPVVASVLDLIPLLLPEYRGGAKVRAYMRLVARAARQASQVIAISEDSRHDIIARLGCDPARVTTTPLAAGEQYRPVERATAQVAERYGLRGPLVYYVGGLDARKNLPVLLRAWARLRRAGGPPATLVLAGRALGGDPQLFPNLEPLIDALGVRESVARVDVPHADGPLLYSAASVFVYPSRYEGFGLPPLEAMACGAPAVVSDASSLPEVAGDAALLVHPDDEAGWAAAIWRLLADPRLHAELRRRGLERAAQFSYDRVARATLRVYAAALAR